MNGPDPFKDLLRAAAAKIREKVTGVATLPPVQAQRPESRPGHPALTQSMASPFVQDTLRRTGFYYPQNPLYQMEYDPSMPRDRFGEARVVADRNRRRGFVGPLAVAQRSQGENPLDLTIAHELAHVKQENDWPDGMQRAVRSRFPDLTAKFDSFTAHAKPLIDYYADPKNYPHSSPPSDRPAAPTLDRRAATSSEQFAYAVENAFRVMRAGDDPNLLAELDAKVPGTREAYQILQERLRENK